ncbi:MAG: gas vesicle protein [Planctomycetota bacterium]
MAQARQITRSTHGDSLADIMERVLTTGVVIAGDIRIKLCDVELLSIQLRLLICSVEKARELGISWWWEEQPSSADPPSNLDNARTPLSVSDASARKPLPVSDTSARNPWEEYKNFREFKRSQYAMRASEKGSG